MANFKRHKCRYLGKNRHSSETFYRKRLGLRPYTLPDYPAWGTPEYYARLHARDTLWPPQFRRMGNWPRSWDILHHSRPRRAKEKAFARAIVKGAKDPDNVCWPLAKKPHIYYW
jgi:hypothetical protein